MLLKISTNYEPATDLGFLLHKNPAKFHEFTIPGGKAYVFYSEASRKRCTACLALESEEVDPRL